MYNQIAPGYDELYKEEQLKKLKVISEILKVNKNDKLLDIGCGTGISTNYFDCISVGIDPSKEMIKLGKGDLRLGNAENLEFEDHSFDIILSLTAIQNFSDIEKSLQEIERVMKDKLVISCLKKSSKIDNVRKLINIYFKDIKEIEEEKDIIFYLV